MGTFCGVMIEDLTGVDSTPIWGDAIGIIIGCLIGIVVPKWLLGSSSDLHGANICSTKSAFLGDMDQVQLEFLVEKD